MYMYMYMTPCATIRTRATLEAGQSSRHDLLIKYTNMLPEELQSPKLSLNVKTFKRLQYALRISRILSNY